MREAIAVAFLKEGKHSSRTSQRRSALTSCPGKLVEKMIIRRLLYTLEYNRLPETCQSDVRVGRSTNEQLVTLQSSMKDVLFRKVWGYGLFILRKLTTPHGDTGYIAIQKQAMFRAIYLTQFIAIWRKDPFV